MYTYQSRLVLVLDLFMILTVLLSACAPASSQPTEHNSTSPDDFVPSADRISFDNLAAGADVTFQLMMNGVMLQSTDGLPVKVVDAATIKDILPYSLPNAVSTTSTNRALEIVFDSPRSKVGMYFSPPDVPAKAILQAYDAQNNLIKQVLISTDPSPTNEMDTFISLEVATELIHYVTLNFEGADAPKIIDDLLIEPGQKNIPTVSDSAESARAVLLSAQATQQDKLEAIQSLLIVPSAAASSTLQEVAQTDEDPYVQERAILALGQLRDPNAIPTLVEIGLNPPDDNVRRAAYHTVWSLRQDFPMPDPPTITVQAVSNIRQGEPFKVEAIIVSPVDRDHVQITIHGSKTASRAGTDEPIGYEGPLVANEAVVFPTTFVIDEIGQTALQVSVRVSLNLVDATTYTVPLYIAIEETTGDGSIKPFPGWDQIKDHIVPLEVTPIVTPPASAGPLDLGSQALMSSNQGLRQWHTMDQASANDLTTRERTAIVTGKILFQDGDTGQISPSLPFIPTGPPKPGRLIKVYLVNRNDFDEVFGVGWTDNSGSFTIIAWRVPNDVSLVIVLEAVNGIVNLMLDFDADNEPFKASLSNSTLPGAATDIDFGTQTVSVNYQPEEIFEGGLLGPVSISVSFAAAMNINDVLLTTWDDIQSNRDPNAGDTLDQVDVEYCDDSGNHYNLSNEIVVMCRLVNGQLPEGNLSGQDYGFVDKTIAHEYGHHLQSTIGTEDHHVESDHAFCTEIDTTFSNDPELAWTEGFADYLAEFIVLSNPERRDPASGAITWAGMSTVNLPRSEDACPNPTLTGEEEGRYSVEGFIAATLWDLTDGHGSRADGWDQVDGNAINGHRTIIQIFDNELDHWGGFAADAPDLKEFYAAWVSRHGEDTAAGRPVLDPILNRMGLVPGGDLPGSLQKQRPSAVVESNPILPSVTLTIPGDAQPQRQYRALSAPFLPQTPTSPVLTITRDWSYLDAMPWPPQHSNDIRIRIGVSNLAELNMDVDGGGNSQQANSADYTTNVMYSPNATNWLMVTPIDGSLDSSQTPQLNQLTFEFLPSAFELDGGQQYQADINVQFSTAMKFPFATIPVSSFSRTIRVIFHQITGPNNDADGDGLTNRQERELLPTQDSAKYGCLNGRYFDSDNDSLADGDEINHWGTSPCDLDSDSDGFADGYETNYACLSPAINDLALDPDGDGLSNVEELAWPETDPCNEDSDKDGILDGQDNCRVTPNPDQSDIDGDGLGDVCDTDIDGDGCYNEQDPTPEDLHNPTGSDQCRPPERDPVSALTGRLWGDLRKYAVFILLNGMQPGDSPSCGALDCPPPWIRLLSEDLKEVLLTLEASDFGFDEQSGFASSATLLPDIDGDGYRDLAIGVTNATPSENLPGSGVVVIASGQTGKELGRIEGWENAAALGTSLLLRGEAELVIGAPGNLKTPGAVYIADLVNFEIIESYSLGEPGDKFGATLAVVTDQDGDDTAELVIGAPGANQTGAVFAAFSTGDFIMLGEGHTVGDNFGYALIAAGDTTGDEVPEVLVGVPGTDLAESTEIGAALLLDLRGEQIWMQTGFEAGERFGYSLAASGTDQESGIATEFVVGAPGWRSNTGRAYVLTAKGLAEVFVTGENKGNEFGTFVAAGPDFDGNGIPSIVVTEQNIWVEGEGFGQSSFYER